MCHLITVAVSGATRDPVDAFRTVGLGAAPAVNARLRDALRAETTPLDITQGGCSCALIQHSRSGLDEDRARRRYLSKGWSQGKIERAIEDKRKSWEVERPGFAVSLFCQAVESIVGNGGRLIAVSHYYEGSYKDEAVSLRGNTTVSLREFLSQSGALPEDTVVTIV